VRRAGGGRGRPRRRRGALDLTADLAGLVLLIALPRGAAVRTAVATGVVCVCNVVCVVHCSHEMTTWLPV